MSDSPVSTIVNDAHLQVALNGLAQIAIAEQEAALAQRAGIDMTEQLKQLRENKDKLLAFKNAYFPNR